MSDIEYNAMFDNYVSFIADFGIISTISVVVDPTVTEDSSNPVASSGIYSFVKEEIGDEAEKRRSSDEFLNSKINDAVASIPTKTSDLTNDSGFITEADIPAVPTKTSDLTNDSGFITESDIPTIPTKTSQLTNDSGYITSADVPAPYDDTEIREEISGLDDKIKELELFKFPNVTIIGTPTINNGQISDFSATSYLKFPFLVDFRNQPFEINMAFTTGANVVNQENIFDSDFGLAFAIRNSRFVIAISTNGSSWDLGEGVGTLTVQPNTTYYIKIAWNGSQYILYYSFDGVSYIPDITKAGTAQPYPKQIYIGVGENFASVVNHFGGTINLNNANLKVNGEIFWTGMDDAGISTRADVSLSNIDADGESKIKEVAETNSIKASLANKIEGSALTPLRNNITTLTSQMANKQDKLVSGTNIRTINGMSILGSGDLPIGGGSGTVTSVNNIGPDDTGNVALPLGRIDDPVGRTEYANNYKLTGDGRCVGNNNYQLWKWAVVEGAEYKIETNYMWQFQNTNNVSSSSSAALIGEVQTGSQDKVIVPTGASWLILEVPKTETSIVYRILRESSAGGEAVNKAYVDQQNALQDAEITSIKADLTKLDNMFETTSANVANITNDFFGTNSATIEVTSTGSGFTASNKSVNSYFWYIIPLTIGHHYTLSFDLSSPLSATGSFVNVNKNYAYPNRPDQPGTQYNIGTPTENGTHYTLDFVADVQECMLVFYERYSNTSFTATNIECIDNDVSTGTFVKSEHIPKASAMVLGGVKIGGGLAVTEDGTLSTLENSSPIHYNGNKFDLFNKCLCIGDSLTQGIVNHNETGTDTQVLIQKYSYPSQLKKISGVDTTNLGQGGATSQNWYTMYEDTDVTGHDICIIAIGVNDVAKGTTGGTTEYWLNQIINKVKLANKGIKIFICTITPALFYKGYSEGVNDMIRNVANNTEDCYLLDMTEYSECKVNTPYAQGHLTALGYNKYAKELKSYISKIIDDNLSDFRNIQFVGTDYDYN